MPGVSLDIWDQPPPDDNPAKNLRPDPYMQSRSPGGPPQAPSFPKSAQLNPAHFPSWDNTTGAQKQQCLQNQYDQHRDQQNHTGPTQAYAQTYSPELPGAPRGNGAYSIDAPPAPEPGNYSNQPGGGGTGHPFAVNFQTVPQGPSRPTGPPGPPGRIPPGALRHPGPSGAMSVHAAPPLPMQSPPPVARVGSNGELPTISIQLPGWVNILFIVMAILLGIIVIQLFQIAQALRR